MDENRSRSDEIQRFCRLLRETSRLAEHASLTGSLPKATGEAVRQYNSVLQHLTQMGAVPTGVFHPLEPDASFDSVGLASAQLAAYLDEEDEAGGRRPSVSLRGLGGKRELQNLGEVIREHLPEWLRGQPGSRPPDTPPQPEEIHTVSEAEARMNAVTARLQEVAEQLGKPDLSSARRVELAEELSRLGQEQSRLARRLADLKESGSG